MTQIVERGDGKGNGKDERTGSIRRVAHGVLAAANVATEVASGAVVGVTEYLAPGTNRVDEIKETIAREEDVARRDSVIAEGQEVLGRHTHSGEIPVDDLPDPELELVARGAIEVGMYVLGVGADQSRHVAERVLPPKIVNVDQALRSLDAAAQADTSLGQIVRGDEALEGISHDVGPLA